MDPLSILMTWVTSLVAKSVEKRIMLSGEKYATKALIKGRIEVCIGKVVDSLEPFFSENLLTETQKKTLVDQCGLELQTLIDNSSAMLTGSLDGQKIYEELYVDRQLPESIRNEKLDHLYSLLFPRVAHLVCRIPGLIEQWQKESWAETFRRLDDLSDAMGDLTRKVDDFTSRQSHIADELLQRVRRILLQRVSFTIDLTGLRGDRPEEATMEQMFVQPTLAPANMQDHGIHDTTTESATFLTRDARSVVVAGGGAGKSTWILWLQQQGLATTTKLVIATRLRDWSNRAMPSRDDLVRMVAGQHLEGEVTATEIRHWVQSNMLAFLIDGFDEVKPSRRDEVLLWLRDFAAAVGACPVLITSRPLTTTHLVSLRDWKRFNLEPFDLVRVKDYITRWYRHAPFLKDEQRRVDTNSLAESWVADEALAHLTTSPLMLATLLMVHHLDGALPKGRAEVYSRYITGMLGLWDDRRRLESGRNELTREDKRRLLTRIAIRLHLTDEEQLDEEDILKLLGAELKAAALDKNSHDVLDSLQERSGLLVGPGTFSLVHKSVGEYLIAESIDKGELRDNDGSAIDHLRLFKERQNDRWNNVLFFWAGLARVSDLEKFLDVIPFERGDWSLTAGLLYESSDRLSIESLRRRYTALLKTKPPDEEASWGYWQPKAVPRSFVSNIVAAHPRARGLRESPVWGQICSLILHRKLLWAQCCEASDTLRLFVWMAFVSATPDLRELEAALIASPIDSKEQTPAAIIAFSRSYHWWSRTGCSIPLLRDRFKLIQQVFPQFAGYAPIAMLSFSVKDYEQYTINDLHNTASALLGLTDFEWEDEWLQQTREVALSLFDNHRSDLLAKVYEWTHFAVTKPLPTIPLAKVSILRELEKHLLALIQLRDRNNQSPEIRYFLEGS